jgi:DNA-binding winged helix-turn-helix (wHTH) protein
MALRSMLRVSASPFAGESIRLEPKALELLLFLAANAGRLVTKAEIQDDVWKGTFVTGNGLTRLVAQIRR